LGLGGSVRGRGSEGGLEVEGGEGAVEAGAKGFGGGGGFQQGDRFLGVAVTGFVEGEGGEELGVLRYFREFVADAEERFAGAGAGVDDFIPVAEYARGVGTAGVFQFEGLGGGVGRGEFDGEAGRAPGVFFVEGVVLGFFLIEGIHGLLKLGVGGVEEFLEGGFADGGVFSFQFTVFS